MSDTPVPNAGLLRRELSARNAGYASPAPYQKPCEK
jgi:hypothetical protein